MYQFYHDYLKPKYKDKVKLMYMDTNSFILSIDTDDFFKDTKDDLQEWFDTSGYDKNRVLPEEFAKNASYNKKVIGKMKDELSKGHMVEFVGWLLRYMLLNKLILIIHFQKIKKLEVLMNQFLKRVKALISIKSVYSIMKQLNAYNTG